jgi:hypothetical protein
MVMGAIGNAKEWKEDLFPYELIPEILELIISSWKTFKKPGSLDHEVPISRAFTKKLQYEKNKQNNLPFKIRSELEIYGTDENKNDDGRIDICFDYIGTPNEETYFAFECKRLRIPYPPPRRLATNNSDYVGKQGMICFVTGKYSKIVTSGGMIGYIMDGKIKEAIISVGKLIKSKRLALKLAKGMGLERSSVMANSPNVRETRHIFNKRNFTIHHIFLAV